MPNPVAVYDTRGGSGAQEGSCFLRGSGIIVCQRIIITSAEVIALANPLSLVRTRKTTSPWAHLNSVSYVNPRPVTPDSSPHVIPAPQALNRGERRLAGIQAEKPPLRSYAGAAIKSRIIYFVTSRHSICFSAWIPASYVSPRFDVPGAGMTSGVGSGVTGWFRRV